MASDGRERWDHAARKTCSAPKMACSSDVTERMDQKTVALKVRNANWLTAWNEVRIPPAAAACSYPMALPLQPGLDGYAA